MICGRERSFRRLANGYPFLISAGGTFLFLKYYISEYRTYSENC